MLRMEAGTCGVCVSSSSLTHSSSSSYSFTKNHVHSSTQSAVTTLQEKKEYFLHGENSILWSSSQKRCCCTEWHQPLPAMPVGRSTSSVVGLIPYSVLGFLSLSIFATSLLLRLLLFTTSSLVPLLAGIECGSKGTGINCLELEWVFCNKMDHW